MDWGYKMKKISSILLSIIFSLCLLGTLLLSVVRFNFSYSSITQMISQMMKPVAVVPVVDDGLFHPGDVSYSLAAYEDYGDFDFSSIDMSSIDFTNMDVNELVQTYLDAAGLDVEPEFIAEVLASPEISDFVNKYVGEVVSYMAGSSDELSINSDDILKVMNKSLDMYEAHTGEIVDRSGMQDAVESNVAVIQEQIKVSLDEVKAENAEYLDILKQVEFFLSLKFYLICVGICLLLIVLLFVINRNIFIWLKYVFLPCFIDGVIIFVLACTCQGILPKFLEIQITAANLPKGFYEGVWSVIAKILFSMKIYGSVAAILGIALFALGFSLSNKTAAGK